MCLTLSFRLLRNPFQSHPSLTNILPIESVSLGGSDGKESACNAGDLGSIPWLGMLEEFVTSSLLLATAKIWRNGWTSVTAPCYSSVLFSKQREIHPWGMRMGRPKRLEEKRNPWLNFGSSFYLLFLLPLSLPYVNLASQEICSHSSPQTFLCSIFVGFSLHCLLATTILDSFFLF